MLDRRGREMPACQDRKETIQECTRSLAITERSYQQTHHTAEYRATEHVARVVHADENACECSQNTKKEQNEAEPSVESPHHHAHSEGERGVVAWKRRVGRTGDEQSHVMGTLDRKMDMTRLVI